MKHRGVDINGNWVFGKGKNSYAIGTDAVKINIRTRLLCFKNNCFFDLDAGIDWWNLGSGNDRNLKMLDLQIREIISGSYGVDKVISSNIDFNRITRTISVVYKIKLIDESLLTDIVAIGVLNA